MKALSLTQPWAWLVVNAGKNIENRRWNTSHRGEFLIHASKAMDVEDYIAATEMQREIHGKATVPGQDTLQRGGIVARANLVHVYFALENRGRWSMSGQFGFVLEDMRPTPFVPCRGALNFWEVPVEVLAALNAAEGRR